MMSVHISFRKPVSCDVAMTEPPASMNLLSQFLIHAMFVTSRCPVGSSSISTSALTSVAAQSCIFTFQPPENVVIFIAASAARSLPVPRSELPKPISSITSATCSRVTGGVTWYTLLHASTTQSMPLKSMFRIGNFSSSSPTSRSWISCSTKIVRSSSRFGKPSICSRSIARISVVLPQLFGPSRP